MIFTSTQSITLLTCLFIVASGYTDKTAHADEQTVSKLPNIRYQGTLLREQTPKKKSRRKLNLLALDYDNGIQVRNNRMFFPIMGETRGMLSLSPDRIKVSLLTGNENTRLVLRGDKKRVYLKFNFYF